MLTSGQRRGLRVVTKKTHRERQEKTMEVGEVRARETMRKMTVGEKTVGSWSAGEDVTSCAEAAARGEGQLI